MSHKANYWLASLDPSRVKAGAFRVLFHLCDHHNAETDPARACFPSQDTLRDKTGLSNGALNNALNEMEEGGILLRRRSTVPGSRERRTYYILGCDFDLTAKQTPENGVCTNSSPLEPETEQTPVSEASNSILEANKLQPTGEEPVRNQVSNQGGGEEGAREAMPVQQSRSLVSAIADALGFLDPDGRGWPKYWMAGDAPLIAARWQTDLGLTESEILTVATSNMRAHGSPANGPKTLTPHMQAYAAAKNAPPLEIPTGRGQRSPPEPAINDNVIRLLNERLGITEKAK